MKKIYIFTWIIFSFLLGSWAYAQSGGTIFVSASGTELIVPKEIDWTQRFILTELKELRIDLEGLKREINKDLNERELKTVDRALAYSGNTVNFLWLILTMAVTGFGLVGWKTMRDVRENLSKNFEREVQKRVRQEQKKLEVFMKTFEEEQLAQSQEILKNQEYLHKKQETAFYWSQFNREDDPVHKLEFLDNIAAAGLEADELYIYVERAAIYINLGLWDKALEMAEKWLEIESENISLLEKKAQSLMMLDQADEALRVVTNILVMKPSAFEEIISNPVFENYIDQIKEIVNNSEVINT